MYVSFGAPEHAQPLRSPLLQGGPEGDGRRNEGWTRCVLLYQPCHLISPTGGRSREVAYVTGDPATLAPGISPVLGKDGRDLEK